MKDSIALADGNKALGNIVFGISSSEFFREDMSFMMRNDNRLYGSEIQNIDGLFTNADELCQVTFVSCVEKQFRRGYHPFREFVIKKFGLESSKDNWVVGNRRIILAVENRYMDFDYMTRLENQDRRSLLDPDKPVEPLNAGQKFDYCVMYIRSDSLYAVYKREQTEGMKPRLQDVPEEPSATERQLQGL